MARNRSFMTVSTNGVVYYGRRDPKTGRFVKAGAGNDIDYVFRKMEEMARFGSKGIYNELVKMSKAFFESYVSGIGGAKMPELTGNLIDSSSIQVARGESDRYSQHVAQAHATRPQRWGNWAYIEKGSGWGEDYRIDSADEVIPSLIFEGYRKADVAVVLHVGIPYAGPLDMFGAHEQQAHKDFFKEMAGDFRDNVMEISYEVAAEMERINKSSGSIGARSIARDL